MHFFLIFYYQFEYLSHNFEWDDLEDKIALFHRGSEMFWFSNLFNNIYTILYHTIYHTILQYYIVLYYIVLQRYINHISVYF